MTEIIWIPGIGNTETFDGALVPPGGHIVSTSAPSPTPTSASGASSIPTPVATASSGSSGGSGGGGLYNPGVASSGGYTPPSSYTQGGVTTVPKTPTVDPAAAARAARAAEIAANTVWDNIPAVKALQMQDWQIYVDTGLWNTPQQLALHTQAEEIRKSTNPLYPGSGAGGPITQGDENKVALPGVAPDSAIGKIAPVAVLGIGAILLIGMLKG